ncbi:MAG: FKBP-type peptidyl-prolyl cis-trans isomerase [Gammaproteobacteria bacterium]|nr:FKBP-type peptidyl-prolyl cis-trans isomerase [Gammaproteobacteria bacterium]
MKKVFIVLLLAWSVGVAAETAVVSVSERYSYAMGARLGEMLKSQGIGQIDAGAFAAAIDDVMQGRPLRLSAEEMRQAVVDQQKVFAEQRAQRAEETLRAGRDFLAANARKPDIVVLPSGLQYRVLASGEGEQPTAADSVRVHYHGTKIDGSVFDSSVDRGQPAEFSLGGVIPGFREALLNMRVGDHWQVFLPSSMAYGDRGAGASIGPNEALIFDLQLLAIKR